MVMCMEFVRGRVRFVRYKKRVGRDGDERVYEYTYAVIRFDKESTEKLMEILSDGDEVRIPIKVFLQEQESFLQEKSDSYRNSYKNLEVKHISVTEIEDLIEKLRVPLNDNRIKKILSDRLKDFVASGLDYEVYEEDDLLIVAYRRSDYGVLVVPQDSEKGFFIGKLLRKTQWVYDRDTDSMLVAMKNIGQRIRIWDSKKRKFVAEF